MSNPNSPISEANLMAYIYEDVDDTDIFGLSTANTFSNAPSETKNDEGAEQPELAELLKERSLLKDQLKQVKTEKELLEVSVSQLYRTAKAEMDRKDRRILELTQKLDSLVFRRRNDNRSLLEDVPDKSQLQKEIYNAKCNANYTKRKEDGLTTQNDKLPKRVSKSEENASLNEYSKEVVNKNSNSAVSSAHVPRPTDVPNRKIESSQSDPRSSSVTKSSSNENKDRLIDQDANIMVIDTHSPETPVVKSEKFTKIKSEIAKNTSSDEKSHQTEPSNHQVVPEKDLKKEVSHHLKSDYKIPRNKIRETDETDRNMEKECNRGIDENQFQKTSILSSEKSVLCKTDSDVSGKLATTTRTARIIKEPIRRSRRNSEHVPRPPRTPSGSPPRDSSEPSPRRTQSRERFDRFTSQRQSSRSNNYKENPSKDVRKNSDNNYKNKHLIYTDGRSKDGRKSRYESNAFPRCSPERSHSLEKYERSSKPDRKYSFDVTRFMRGRSKFRYTDRRDFNLRSRLNSKGALCLRDRRRIDYKSSVQSRKRFSRSSSSEQSSKREAGRENVETYKDWRKRSIERNPIETQSVHQNDMQKSSRSNQEDDALKRSQEKRFDLKETMRKDYETDFSDWDDFRLHLSPSSDDTVVYHNQHSKASSIAYGKFGVDVELMDDEELEKAVKRKQKELEDIQRKRPHPNCTEPDDAEVSKLSKNNNANKKKEISAEDESSSKTRKHQAFSPTMKKQATEFNPKTDNSAESEHVLKNEHVADRKLQDFEEKNDQTEQLVLKGHVNDVGRHRKHRQVSSLDLKKSKSSLKRSSKSKPGIETSKELYAILSDENLDEKSKSCSKVKPANSYKSLFIKLEEISKEHITFKLNRDGKLNTKELIEKNQQVTSADNQQENIRAVKTGHNENPSASSNAETNCSDDIIVKSEDKKKIDLNTYKKRVNVKAEVALRQDPEPVLDVLPQNSNIPIDQDNINNTENEQSPNDSAETIICLAIDELHTDNNIKSIVSQSKGGESCTNENDQFDPEDGNALKTSDSDEKPINTPQGSAEEIVKRNNTSFRDGSPVADATMNCEEKTSVSPKNIQEESKDLDSFIHDFSLSDDEISFSETKGLRDVAVARNHLNKINILDVSIVRPGSANVFKIMPEKVASLQDFEATPIDPSISHFEKCDTSNVQQECIESIQEAIKNNGFVVEESLCLDRLKNDESNKLDTEQLQRCLEDDVCIENVEINETKVAESPSKTFCSFGIDNATDQSSKLSNDSNGKLDVARRSSTPPNLPHRTRVQEQMLRLFGSESKSESDPIRKGVDTVKKNLTAIALIDSATAQENPQAKTQPKIRSSKNKTADEILCSILKKQIPSNLKESSYSVFCNNPNYIPNPPDLDFRKKLAEHIEKQEQIELEVCKNLDKSLEKKDRNLKAQKRDEKTKELPETKTSRKSKCAENCIKIKMPFNSPSKKGKKLDDSNDSDQKIKKKALKRARVIDSDTEDEKITESNSEKESLKKRPKKQKGSKNTPISIQKKSSINKGTLLTNKDATEVKVNENQCEKDSRVESEPKHKDDTEISGTSAIVSTYSLPETVTNQTDESCTKKEIASEKRAINTKQVPAVGQMNDPLNETLEGVFKAITPRRITPVKIGEASFSKVFRKKKVNDSNEIKVPEESPSKSQNAQFVKANQSPLPHMEEMLKQYVNKSNDVREALVNTSHSVQVISVKAASHVYTNDPSIIKNNTCIRETTNFPEVNQINLDSKDISMLGAVERVIFDNMTAYLADKSLPTFENENANNKSEKSTLGNSEALEPKDSTSPLDFSNMLRKNLNTSTPIKPKNARQADEKDKVHTQNKPGPVNINSQSSELMQSIAKDLMSDSTRSYITSPLKRERRRRVKILTGIM
ncbi:uncharacterized protein LOC109540301 isoform X1 [Dendroctonus ponderosae]|uniref:uncharacterized protein LOC109540301 isoform X1 n=2 Tax=Dendroctonus ponderosae TaxID=77166 RepID=UPI002034DAC4|nr:uncharacterized protein LOC109540301 isoform X1 [Dendroctonus ponderosae]KAH1023914.1 hypothetical protein HUJ05_003492 [Dendroctonus ponderosae]KAH1023915.1 hypothetical protein HUJ05_003492 [Dendroctonus ponderosae]